MELHILDSVPSTNQYCELLDLSQVGEFAVFAAHAQTSGIGQRGNCWASAPHENLTGSIILKPRFLPFADQFRLTQTVSLALIDFLSSLLPNGSGLLQIKWPNDIYVGLKKICGILISNRIQGEHMGVSIVGIGLNVNQTEFPDWVPNPTSLRQITGNTYTPDKLWSPLADALECRYSQLRNQPESFEQLGHVYLSRLMNWHKEATYLYQNRKINATIEGVNRYGHLQLTTADGNRLSCQMQEIKLVL